MRPLLTIIFVLAIGGLAFSGYLSYRELFGPPGAATCPSVGAPGTVLGSPACVYGFFMYLAIAVIAAVALARRRTAA